VFHPSLTYTHAIFSSAILVFSHLHLCPTLRSTGQISKQYKTCRTALPFRCRVSGKLWPEVRAIGLYCKKGQRFLSFYSVLTVTRPIKLVPRSLPTTRPHLMPILRTRGAIPPIFFNGMIN